MEACILLMHQVLLRPLHKMEMLLMFLFIVGHVDGHINVLARTSSDGAWILLGADSAHHPDLVTGKLQVAHIVNEETGEVTCIHADKGVAEETIRRMRSLLEIPRVQVLIAHDSVWYQENKDKEVFLPHKIPPCQERFRSGREIH